MLMRGLKSRASLCCQWSHSYGMFQAATGNRNYNFSFSLSLHSPPGCVSFLMTAIFCCLTSITKDFGRRSGQTSESQNIQQEEVPRLQRTS